MKPLRVEVRSDTAERLTALPGRCSFLETSHPSATQAQATTRRLDEC